MVKTLYSVLGVAPNALPEEIDDAFNRLKLQHPQSKLDTDEAARMRFLAMQQAYQTLSDPDARALYDRKIAKAGIKVATDAYAVGENNAGWLSTRNVIIVGLTVLLVSGSWTYHARQKAREEKEVAERILRLAEEEKRRAAELREAEEARRDAQLEERQRQQEERRFRLENERIERQLSAERRNAERQAAQQRQREKAQMEREAERRLQQEKAQLRELCRQRYNRPDC